MKSYPLLILILIFNSQFLSGQCKLDSLDSYQIDASGKSLYGARFLINYSTNGNQFIEDRIQRDTISKNCLPAPESFRRWITKGGHFQQSTNIFLTVLMSIHRERIIRISLMEKRNPK